MAFALKLPHNIYDVLGTRTFSASNNHKHCIQIKKEHMQTTTARTAIKRFSQQEKTVPLNAYRLFSPSDIKASKKAHYFWKKTCCFLLHKEYLRSGMEMLPIK
jgi:hypothetical protein